jgi:Fe2+ or Zn2+ uptake regulation protein
LESLLEIVKKQPDGISIEEVLHFMRHEISRRTVQYRLSTLVKNGFLRMKGAGRSSKYYIVPSVENKMDKLKSIQFIAKFAHEHIPSTERHRFIEIVEVEVISLHEGNFARFTIRPSEFFAWQRSWK